MSDNRTAAWQNRCKIEHDLTESQAIAKDLKAKLALADIRLREALNEAAGTPTSGKPGLFPGPTPKPTTTRKGKR